MEEESTLKIILKFLKRRLNIRTLFILILLLSVNTYAWFIYSTRVAGGVSARVRAWDVLFQVGEEEISQDVSFNLTDLFPGMENYTDGITVKNRGETNASFEYEINRVSILGTVYEKSDELTSNDIETLLQTNFPFKLVVGTTTTELLPNSEATFNVSVSWPYESGDDVADTTWGELAYDYKNDNPTLPSITIDVTISAVQSRTSEE